MTHIRPLANVSALIHFQIYSTETQKEATKNTKGMTINLVFLFWRNRCRFINLERTSSSYSSVHIFLWGFWLFDGKTNRVSEPSCSTGFLFVHRRSACPFCFSFVIELFTELHIVSVTLVDFYPFYEIFRRVWFSAHLSLLFPESSIHPDPMSSLIKYMIYSPM